MRRLVAIIGAVAIVAAAPSFAFAGQTAPKGENRGAGGQSAGCQGHDGDGRPSRPRGA